MIRSLLRLFDEVRLLDHRLIQVAEALHAGNPVSIPGRAVLEYIVHNGPASVPDIARARYVSRQHIQVNADRLIELGLVKVRPNPAHRRSSLLSLTDAGTTAIASMHERERHVLEKRLATMRVDNVDSAAALLARVRAALDEQTTP